MFTTEIRENHKLDLAAEVLQSGGRIRLQALGTSMLPSIWPGDVLSIESRPGEEAVPGDIVLVARDHRFFVHRLIEKHNSLWITRGDSLPQNDPPVGESQVLGKVSAIHRRDRVIVPSHRVSRLARLCHWDSFRNVALRIHSFQQRGSILVALQEPR
jgi:SOS-response transcriptional repressor LexA